VGIIAGSREVPGKKDLVTRDIHIYNNNTSYPYIFTSSQVDVQYTETSLTSSL